MGFLFRASGRWEELVVALGTSDYDDYRSLDGWRPKCSAAHPVAPRFEALDQAVSTEETGGGRRRVFAAPSKEQLFRHAPQSGAQRRMIQTLCLVAPCASSSDDWPLALPGVILHRENHQRNDEMMKKPFHRKSMAQGEKSPLPPVFLNLSRPKSKIFSCPPPLKLCDHSCCRR